MCSSGSVAAEGGTRQVGKSRVWGVRGLAKQKLAAPRTHRNRWEDSLWLTCITKCIHLHSRHDI